jgi:hypothetical protein
VKNPLTSYFFSLSFFSVNLINILKFLAEIYRLCIKETHFSPLAKTEGYCPTNQDTQKTNGQLSQHLFQPGLVNIFNSCQNYFSGGNYSLHN